MNARNRQSLDILASADEIVSARDVDAALNRMAGEIRTVLAGTYPLVLGVMRGSVVFAGQLLPRLDFPLDFDYLDVTRYGDATQGGALSWKVSPGTAVNDRTVLVLDDILDEGHTLAAIRERLLAAGAQRVWNAVFADKDNGLDKPIRADFTGVVVPNRYVFGFGMDVRGAWRNLPAIYALKEGDE